MSHNFLKNMDSFDYLTGWNTEYKRSWLHSVDGNSCQRSWQRIIVGIVVYKNRINSSVERGTFGGFATLSSGLKKGSFGLIQLKSSYNKENCVNTVKTNFEIGSI